ncbi:MAG TPA: hypothetical protein V6C76_11595 [Drouetiella sp.]
MKNLAVLLALFCTTMPAIAEEHWTDVLGMKVYPRLDGKPASGDDLVGIAADGKLRFLPTPVGTRATKTEVGSWKIDEGQISPPSITLTPGIQSDGARFSIEQFPKNEPSVEALQERVQSLEAQVKNLQKLVGVKHAR